MNLLLIHQVFVTDDEAGGTRHYELAKHLSERGDSVTVVASQISYLTGKPIDDKRGGLLHGFFYRDRISGITVLRAFAPAVHHKSFFWRVVAFLVFAITSVWAGWRAGRFDVVMGTSPPIFQAVSAWLVARLRRKPFLLEVRDLWPEFAIEMGVLRNPVLKILSRWLERFLYQRADHLLVNSPAYRDYLIQKGVPKEQISFVPNGVNIAMFDPTNRGADVRLRYGLEGKCVAVYAGAIGLANNLDVVLRAADLLRNETDIHFLFVGDGKDRMRLEIEADRLGCRNVSFAGPLPKSQMPGILAAADICVATLMDIPMFSTTYPNKVFDYMGAGRPTVLAIDGVIRTVIEEAGAGIFVKPNDAHALADAVSVLSKNTAMRQLMGRSAREYVTYRFNREDQAEQFRKILNMVSNKNVVLSNDESSDEGKKR